MNLEGAAAPHPRDNVPALVTAKTTTRIL